MALLSNTKKSISALQLQKELGHKRYEPIWAMLHKLRLVMRHRDTRYELKDHIELDDGFFETADRSTSEEGSEKDNEANKRGRGSTRQAKMLVAVESKAVKNPKKGKKDKKVGYLKMTVMDDLKQIGVQYEVQKMINKNATVLTDGYPSYSKLKEIVAKHEAVIVPDKSKVCKIFPWVHTAISNAKRLLLGIHHSIKSTYLQNYLDEFCYKFNRRFLFNNLFDRLLIASVTNNR